MTEEMRETWKAWFILEAGKRFRMNRYRAEKEFNWFDLSYGLKINNDYDPERKE